MRTDTFTIVVALMCGLYWNEPASAEPSYVIVINRENPVNEITTADLKAIFRQKKTVWPWGGAIKPVNQKEYSAARKTFTKEIFSKDPSTMEAYYLKRALSGKGQPPRTLKTDKDVLNYIASKKGAIGYVTKTDSTVKTLKVK